MVEIDWSIDIPLVEMLWSNSHELVKVGSKLLLEIWEVLFDFSGIEEFESHSSYIFIVTVIVIGIAERLSLLSSGAFNPVSSFIEISLIGVD